VTIKTLGRQAVRKEKGWNWSGIMCSGGVLTNIEPSVNVTTVLKDQ